MFCKYFTDEIEIQKLVISVIRIVAFIQPASSATTVISSALQGAGETKFPMYTTIFGIWGIRVLFGYIFAIKCGFGLVGIWLAYAMDMVVRSILLMIKYLVTKWDKIMI